MKNKTRILQALLFVFMAAFIAQGTELEGRVRLVGTSLFPRLVISTAEKDYYFDESLIDEFKVYQNQTIKIRASKIEDVVSQLADGSKTFIRPTIYEAVFVSVSSGEL